jgi:hypothetical protein
LTEVGSLIEMSSVGLILSLAILASLYLRGYFVIKGALAESSMV